ncbi:glycosyltransferase [Methylibium sp.]|uniref:glycosyltransferase n=1 Tax=Methylibium sp. TaxID=2067992 RepID=UPI003D10ED24
MSAAENTAVILVNWCGWRDTLECLGSLLLLRAPPASIIVVENASPDDSAQHLGAWCRGETEQAPEREQEAIAVLRRAPADLDWLELWEDEPMPLRLPRVLILRSRTNGGFAGGNNLGLRVAYDAGLSKFWLLNTDTVVPPDALEQLLVRAKAKPEAGMVGSTLIYYWRPDQVQALGGASFDPATGVGRHLGDGKSVDSVPQNPMSIESQMGYVVGASILASREFIRDIGPMCEDYFLYFEEIDWALRARGKYGLAYAPLSRVYHKVGGSSMKYESRSSLRYLYRNRLRLVGRFFPKARGRALAYMFVQVLQHARRRHWADVRELLGAIAHSRQLFALEASK